MPRANSISRLMHPVPIQVLPQLLLARLLAIETLAVRIVMLQVGFRYVQAFLGLRGLLRGGLSRHEMEATHAESTVWARILGPAIVEAARVSRD